MPLLPVVGLAVAFLGSSPVGSKVGVPQDLPDLFDGQRVIVHCILQEYVQCFNHLVRLSTLSNEALPLPLQVRDPRLSRIEERLDVRQLHPRRSVDDDPLDASAVLDRVEPVVRPASLGGGQEALCLPVMQRSHRQRESLGDLADGVESVVIAHGNDPEASRRVMVKRKSVCSTDASCHRYSCWGTIPGRHGPHVGASALITPPTRFQPSQGGQPCSSCEHPAVHGLPTRIRCAALRHGGGLPPGAQRAATHPVPISESTQPTLMTRSRARSTPQCPAFNVRRTRNQQHDDSKEA